MASAESPISLRTYDLLRWLLPLTVKFPARAAVCAGRRRCKSARLAWPQSRLIEAAHAEGGAQRTAQLDLRLDARAGQAAALPAAPATISPCSLPDSTNTSRSIVRRDWAAARWGGTRRLPLAVRIAHQRARVRGEVSPLRHCSVAIDSGMRGDRRLLWLVDKCCREGQAELCACVAARGTTTPRNARAAYRNNNTPGNLNDNIGFRLVRGPG